MFTGIIEATTQVENIKANQGNLEFTFSNPFDEPVKIDQSIAHNGVCLTVTNIKDKLFSVTAIEETLQKTNLGELKAGDTVNLERCMKIGDRLDGHIVQGHVDQTAKCISKEEKDGSWIFTFEYEPSQNITVEKGSICVNGVSLTVIDSKRNSFSVAIIPYTYENTSFKYLKPGDTVNLEFDIIGKYVARLFEFKAESSKFKDL